MNMEAKFGPSLYVIPYLFFRTVIKRGFRLRRENIKAVHEHVMCQCDIGKNARICRSC